MKRNLIHGTACLLIALPAANAQERRQISEPATHEELAARLKQQQSDDPLRSLARQEGRDPSKENQPQDLLSRSDILCFNGMATLVPKKSILALPAQLADRVGMQTGAKLVGWAEFHAANRGWLTTQEITLAQARGEQPFAEGMEERFSKSTNVIVATLQGGPISKLQPTPPSPPAN